MCKKNTATSTSNTSLAQEQSRNQPAVVQISPDSSNLQTMALWRKCRVSLIYAGWFIAAYLLFTCSQKRDTNNKLCDQSSETIIYNERSRLAYNSLYPNATSVENINSTPNSPKFYPNSSQIIDQSRVSQKISVSTNNDPTLDELESMLKDRLNEARKKIKPLRLAPGCDTKATLSNSCDNNTCLRLKIDENPRERLAQVIEPPELRLTLQTKQDTRREMTSKINKYYDIILLTGASDNHFDESQALLKSLHSTIFPKLKNFTLIYYNLGLKPRNRQLLEKACNCTVIDFPFDKFPSFITDLWCYSWKAPIVNAHINQANVVAWLDSSVRFHDFKGFLAVVDNTRKRGIQLSYPSEMNPLRTDRGMFHFFGDEPCAHLHFPQAAATLIFFKNDRFIKRAVIEPWVGCSLKKNCICPEGFVHQMKRNSEMSRKWREGKGPVIYGLVHRYDQSAINLILSKLFAHYFLWTTYNRGLYKIEAPRGQTAPHYLSDRSKLPKL